MSVTVTVPVPLVIPAGTANLRRYQPPSTWLEGGGEKVPGTEIGMLYCPNFDCPARQLEGLVHFASRGAMDIRGLSYARLSQLIVGDAVLLHGAAKAIAFTLQRDFLIKEADILLMRLFYSAKQALALLSAKLFSDRISGFLVIVLSLFQSLKRRFLVQ